MKEENFVLRGNICYSRTREELAVFPRSYAVCIQGKSAGVFPKLPEKYRSLPLYDYGESIIIPGMTYLHLHAPQYTFVWKGMYL